MTGVGDVRVYDRGMGRQPGAVVACIALVLTLAAADRAVGLNWSAQTLPTPTIPTGELVGVSCPSVKFCLAVGDAGDEPLAERRSDGHWTLLPAPRVAGGDLTAVSCSSSTACTAVGVVPLDTRVGINALVGPLVERWDGRRWSRQAVATRLGRRVIFDGISCPGRRSCFAVGSILSGQRSRPVIERWNGRRWSIQPIADAGAHGLSGALGGVSCRSNTACTAVGEESNRSLIECWNGTRWQRLKSIPQLSLGAVSCLSASRCVALGLAVTRDGDIGEADTISAGRQSIIAMAPSGGEPDFAAFACATATVCLAVGSFSAGSGGPLPLLAVLSHGRWTTPTVGPVNALGGLGGVSCPVRRSCVITGGVMTPPVAGITLAVHWNGSRFATETTPNGATPATVQLSAVSCASSAACVAVGSFTDATGVQRTLAEGWNGTRWSLQSIPNPPGTADSMLNGVSCPTTDSCIAVGSSGFQPLAERWDGSRWEIQATPAAGSGLAAVSCSSAAACTAVSTLAESWDGTTWTLRAAPTGGLTSVSCGSPSTCTAVGALTSNVPVAGATNPLAESWNGAAWTVQTTPSPPGGGRFTAVACSAPSACTAVGGAAGGNSLLGAGWDGTRWSVEVVPSPPMDPGGSAALNGVSCTAPTNCTAVGSAESSTVARQLAYVWNGTAWAAQRLPAPGAADGLLNAVSCTSATTCTAVGSDGGAAPTALRSS